MNLWITRGSSANQQRGRSRIFGKQFQLYSIRWLIRLIFHSITLELASSMVIVCCACVGLYVMLEGNKKWIIRINFPLTHILYVVSYNISTILVNRNSLDAVCLSIPLSLKIFLSPSPHTLQCFGIAVKTILPI